jgi:hypothetical protein
VASDALGNLIRRPWRDAQYARTATGIPTMLSKSERRLLYGLARDYASGEGAIVDAGCFLGGSTAALLSGLRDRGTPWTGPPLESFDLFRVEEFTLAKFFSDGSLRVGDSFRSRFDAHVAGFDTPHVVHEGDIIEIGWSGEPIEVLFLDVLKSWDINDAVLRDFFPALIPGRSVIVHQDYGWGDTPWIPITVELMRESLALIDWMEWGSHAFLVEREIPRDVLEHGVAHLDIDTKLELNERATAQAEGWVEGMLEVSRCFLVAERDGPDAALAQLRSIAERHPQHGFVLGCIEDVRPQIAALAAAAR